MEYLLSISLRSGVLAAVALLIVWPMRSPAAKHAVWTIVTFGILLQTLLTSILPSVPLRVLGSVAPFASQTITTSEPAVNDLAMPDLSVAVTQPATPRGPQAGFNPTWTIFLTGLYFAGVVIFAARLVRAFLFTRSLLQECVPVGPNRYQSRRVAVPMTFGSKIILPHDWSGWPETKLNAVLEHESAHIRRCDWWISLVSRVNQCLLWFHPLAWWLDRELARLAEQACDDAALLAVEDRELYSQTLLDMARAAHLSQGRLLASSMAQGADVEVRMDRILDETRQISRAMTRTAWTALAALSLPLIYLAATVQLAPAETVKRATGGEVRDAAIPEIAPAVVAAPKTKILLAQSTPVPAVAALAVAEKAQDYSHFEVASIRPSQPKPNLPAGRVPAPILDGGPGSPTPERINYSNVSPWTLIVQAFDIKSMQLVSPQWAGSALFDITATLPADATKAQLRTMLQNLLTERFHLTLHHETQVLPVYALMVGKNGLKLKESNSTSAPVVPGTVIGIPDKDGFPTLPPEYAGTVARPSNGRLRITGQKQTLAQLAGMVQSPLLEHPIVDQTGVTGQYDFKLEIEWVSRSPTPSGDVLDAPPTVFQALDKLGLKLELKQLPYDVLVVDQLEKVPTEN